jgi:transcriptional regulator with XRE-family HTH domain
VRYSDNVPVLLRELGQQLATLRREAGLTQENLAALMAFSRSTVSVAEIGHQPQSRQFWAACDKALDTGGVLAAGCDQIHAVRQAEERAAACAAQQAHEARALGRLHRSPASRRGRGRCDRGSAMPAVRLPGRGPDHFDLAAFRPWADPARRGPRADRRGAMKIVVTGNEGWQ